MLWTVKLCILFLHTDLSLERGALFDHKTSFTAVHFSVVENIPGLKYVQCIFKCLEFKTCQAAVVSEGNVTVVCKLLLRDDITTTTYYVGDSTVWLKRHAVQDIMTETTTEPTEPRDLSSACVFIFQFSSRCKLRSVLKRDLERFLLRLDRPCTHSV